MIDEEKGRYFLAVQSDRYVSQPDVLLLHAYANESIAAGNHVGATGEHFDGEILESVVAIAIGATAIVVIIAMVAVARGRVPGRHDGRQRRRNERESYQHCDPRQECACQIAQQVA